MRKVLCTARANPLALSALAAMARFLLALTALASAAPDVWAGTLTVQSTSIPGLNPKSPILSYTLRFTGVIEASDSEKLRTELSKIRARIPADTGRPIATIELGSKGGDLLEGIKIGYLLREFEVATLVRNGDVCLSACALAFLGGTQSRHRPVPIPSRRIAIGGKVGFQNFTINVSKLEAEAKGESAVGINRTFTLARAGAAQMMRFTTDMGISPIFISQLLGQPPDQWLLVATVGDFLETGSCPVGSLPNPGRLEAQAANVCANATGGVTDVDPSRAQRMSASQAQRHLLEQVRSSIVNNNLKGPLANQLAAVVANSDQRLIESVYADLRAAGVNLPEMKEVHFEVVTELGAAAQVECHVSLSLDLIDSWDFAMLTPNGLARPFRMPPPACPGLFRYNRNDTINPGDLQ